MDSTLSSWVDLDIFLKDTSNSHNLEDFLLDHPTLAHEDYTVLLQYLTHHFLKLKYNDVNSVPILDEEFVIKTIDFDFKDFQENFEKHFKSLANGDMTHTVVTKDDKAIKVLNLKDLSKSLSFQNEAVRHLLYSIDAQFNCPLPIRQQNIKQVAKIMTLFYSFIYPTLKKTPLPFIHENFFILINFMGDIVAPAFIFTKELQTQQPDLALLFLHVIGCFFSYTFIQLVVTITLSSLINQELTQEDLLFKDEPLRFVDFQDDAPKLNVFFVQQFLEFFIFFDKDILPTLPSNQRTYLQENFDLIRSSIVKAEIIKEKETN
jgi:phage pi2 protein 07